MSEERVCAHCHWFMIEGSGYGWEAWCHLDYHDISEPLKETCEKWITSKDYYHGSGETANEM